MAGTKPLDLPEILHSIGYFLEYKDYFSCILVSHEWHQGMIPFIWRSFTIGHDPARNPPLAALKKHASLVRSLDIFGFPGMDYLALDFPLLEELHLRGNMVPHSRKPHPPPTWRMIDFENAPPPKDLRWYQTFLERHSRLQTFNIINLEPVPDMVFWKAVLALPRLTHLEFHSIPFLATEFLELVKACAPVLEKMVLSSISFWANGSSEDTGEGAVVDQEQVEPPCVNKLRVLDIYNTYETDGINTLLQIAAKSPLLERLYWVPHWRQPHMHQDLYRLIRAKTWPRLDSVGITDSKLSAGEMALLLEHSAPLKSLVAPMAKFDPAAFESLRRHLPTLKEIEVKLGEEADPKWTNEILGSAPMLESLITGQDIFSGDMMAGRPWQARKLTYLSAAIFIDSPEHSRKVFAVLGGLNMLETLAVDVHSTFPREKPALQFRLENGLDLMGYMPRLNTVRLENTAQEMEMEDLEFMLEHWKEIEFLMGPLSTDREKDERMNNRLRGHVKAKEMAL